MTDLFIQIAAIVAILALLSVPVINWLKGKRWMALFAVIGWPIGALFVASVVTAIRVAKPFSWWYERRYGPAEKAVSRERFPLV